MQLDKKIECSYILGHCFQMKSISVSRIYRNECFIALCEWKQKTENCKETRIKCNVGTSKISSRLPLQFHLSMQSLEITISFLVKLKAKQGKDKKQNNFFLLFTEEHMLQVHLH